MLALNLADPEPVVAQAMSIVDQVRLATRWRNCAAMVCGAILGGFVPLATYVAAHHEVSIRPMLAILVAGGLLYSALSVCSFVGRALGSAPKALGFVVLLEGVMIVSGVVHLAIASLAILIAINALTSGTHIALDSRRAISAHRKVTRLRRGYTEPSLPVHLSVWQTANQIPLPLQ